MPNKVFTFIFSPPARMAWLTAKIYKVPTDIVQVDLSKAEQMDLEFLKMNPKHEVPVFDHEGTFVTESRAIAKYFHEHFNIDPEANDHWYPSDPEERRKVDEWLDFSDKRHMSICKPALGTAVSRTDMNWRKHYGIFIALLGKKLKSNKNWIEEMMTNIRDAEGILCKRNIENVKDLNLGDLSLFLEVTLPFFILEDVNFEDYPAIINLYKVIQKIPEFQEIDEGFKEFIKPVLRPIPPSQSVFGYIRELWTSIKLITYIKWNGIAMNA